MKPEKNAREIRVDDVVQMRKPHPCGADTWRITRVGADMGLQCVGCGRRVMLPRRAFHKGLKRVLPAQGDHDESPSQDC